MSEKQELQQQKIPEGFQSCPSCIKFYPPGEMIRLKRGPQDQPGPVVYYGCILCLTRIITDWNHFADPVCYLCGRRKEDLMFPGGATKPECPLHANAARLLGQVLPILGEDFAEGDPVARLVGDIRKLLG